MDFKGSGTEANLRRAFTGEACSQSRYALFAEAARREGREQLAGLFEETARNELAHARIWLTALGGIRTGTENLADAIAEETALWTGAYREMAQTARSEGFSELAARFEGVARAERAHGVRFQKLLENLQEDRVFRRDAPALWQCRNCGSLSLERKAPQVCPVCGFPQGFFQLRAENY